MRVNKIEDIFRNRYVRNDYKKVNNFISPSFKGGIPSDVMIIGPLSFTKLKKFTLNEYMQLTSSEKDLINKAINVLYRTSLDTDLKFHDVAAEAIKRTLDYRFGKDNYVVIPIGRSLSSIGKCLGYKIGEENVKQLPMSRATRFLDIENCNEDFNLFRQYLDSIGLSQKQIETSGKKYVFIDYCDKGGSILGAERLFKVKIWGENKNVSFENVKNLLQEFQQDGINGREFLCDAKFQLDLDDMLYGRKFKDYSLVDMCLDLAKTKDALIKPEHYSFNQKCFLFKLLDNEMRKVKL